jgi:hypothetical protein
MKKSIVIIIVMLLNAACFAQQIKDSEVPAGIKSTALSKFPTGSTPFWVLDQNRKKYIASVLNPPTLMRMVEVGFDGKWLGTTDGVLPEKLPAGVSNTLRKNYLDNGYEASNYFYTQEPGVSPYYLIEVSNDDESLELTLDASGKILKKEVQ